MIAKTLLHHTFKKFFRPECKNQLHFSFLFGSPVRAAWYQLEDNFDGLYVYKRESKRLQLLQLVILPYRLLTQDLGQYSRVL